jgi:hypothetical protein
MLSGMKNWETFCRILYSVYANPIHHCFFDQLHLCKVSKEEEKETRKASPFLRLHRLLAVSSSTFT